MLLRRTVWYVNAFVSEGHVSTHHGGWKQCVISEPSGISLQPLAPIFRGQAALLHRADW